ncbi:ABC transporter ATP-binding protein [Priestia filamentosa]|uniref:ABC transporter ATP-binding protein n=1 Tax=Priestia filamentosa TaxID=1402861 RepID=UPI001FB49B8C|nr:ABC transporter ATP-binding protein [Priestia filamentosa]MED3728807.1 ABC transporter ATP-binding protein [Priestia filamentosa]UOE58488.1 ABC transporter ATP-binding protein [Priestia filamentosa]
MLIVESVEKVYKTGRLFSKEKRKILKNISFECKSGECIGIIGESGSGKSTLGRLLIGIEQPDAGRILFEGRSMNDRLTRLGSISAVFQDYKSSINPFFTVEQAIIEPIRVKKSNKIEIESRIDYLLNQVGLDSSYKEKYPHELSGGQVQRVCIARAIATEPKCILLDEAISSLDVSVQVQILKLLKELKEIYRIGYIFITHDIQAAAYICDRIIIFKNGKIEETVETSNLKNVQSEYARELLQKLITF